MLNCAGDDLTILYGLSKLKIFHLPLDNIP